MLGQMIPVQAASFSVKASKSTISPNSTFTVSISTQGAGQFSVSASNGKVSSSNVWVDGSSSVSITGGSSGTTSVTVTAVDATGYDETPITGSHTVSVKIKSSNGSSSSNSTDTSSSSHKTSSQSNTVAKKYPEVKKSNENRLASLSVSSGRLNPSFSSDKTTYQVDLTSDVKELTINAKAKDNNATVTGTGKKELHIGENIFKITVTAENGSVKRYTLSVNVIEKPTQFITYDSQQLGILNDLSKVDTPKGFEKDTIQIDNKDVTVLQNDKLKLSLLYLQNEKEETGFYIYDVKQNKIISSFQTLTFNGKTYIPISPDNIPESINNLAKTVIKIGDKEISGWKFNNDELSNYTLIHLMNEDGQKNFYTYESSEESLQKYLVLNEDNNTHLTIYILAGTTAGLFITTITVSVLYLRFKRKSIASIKEYYERKNK